MYLIDPQAHMTPNSPDKIYWDHGMKAISPMLEEHNKVCGSNNFALLVKNNINCLLNLNYLENMELMRLYYQDSFNYFG